MMTSTAALALNTPEQTDAAPISGVRTVDPLAELTRRYLEAKALAKAAEEEAAKFATEILANLEGSGRKAVEVPGLGKVSYVASTMSSGLDARAAGAALVRGGHPAPDEAHGAPSRPQGDPECVAARCRDTAPAGAESAPPGHARSKKIPTMSTTNVDRKTLVSLLVSNVTQRGLRGGPYCPIPDRLLPPSVVEKLDAPYKALAEIGFATRSAAVSAFADRYEYLITPAGRAYLEATREPPAAQQPGTRAPGS